MKILIGIVAVIAAIIILLLVAALIIRKDYTVQREIVINKPKHVVFEYIRYLKNQDYYNKWILQQGPDTQKTFTGTDGTVGFVYAWEGDKAGKGEQEIKGITEGQRMDSELRFVRPMEGVVKLFIITEALSENQTKVTWNMASSMKYPVNIMVPLMDGMMGKDMDTSLANLKTILEKQ